MNAFSFIYFFAPYIFYIINTFNLLLQEKSFDKKIQIIDSIIFFIFFNKIIDFSFFFDIILLNNWFVPKNNLFKEAIYMARTAGSKNARNTTKTTVTGIINEEVEVGVNQNIIVSKEKSSDFLGYFGSTPVLNECVINRVIDSGNYNIFYFGNVSEDQQNELKNNSTLWL